MTWRKREIEEAEMQNEEFNRVEREAKARMMAVQYALQEANKHQCGPEDSPKETYKSYSR